MIGAGNVATNMGKALLRAGHCIPQVYSRTPASATALATALRCKAVCRIEDVCRDADIYVIAVKDTVIETVATSLRSHCPGTLLIHTAGSVPLGVLGGAESRSGVVYPLQTFSTEREVDFSSIPCFIEASNAATLQAVASMARSISGNVSEMRSERRKTLHLAAVFACNFTNHCYTLAAKVLEKQGIPFSAMLPLIDETARKVHDMPPAEAQTGPAARNDTTVMEAHLNMLDSKARAVYKLLSESILSQRDNGQAVRDNYGRDT